MSAVWVTADLSVPPRAGGEIRSVRLLSALAQRAPVDLVLLSHRADVDAVRAATGVRSVTHVPPQVAPLRRRARAVRRAIPLQSATFCGAEATEVVRRLAADAALVVADHVWTAPHLPADGRGVLHLHNAEALLLEQGPFRPGRLRAWEHQWEVRTTRRLERWAIARAGSVVCVSDIDASRVGVPDALVVPNGTDAPRRTTPVPTRGSLLFVGSLDYPPNREGVLWWLSNVAPLIPTDVPPLTVVGRSAERMLSDVRSDPRLCVVGDVADVSPYLAAASVVVQPLLRGGGTRLKLVEALGHGRAVVATTLGAEGFPVRDGVHLRLADTPEQMANAVVSLYRDAGSAQRLATAGRELALGYDWTTIGERFADALLSLRGAVPPR